MIFKTFYGDAVVPEVTIATLEMAPGCSRRVVH